MKEYKVATESHFTKRIELGANESALVFNAKEGFDIYFPEKEDGEEATITNLMLVACIKLLHSEKDEAEKARDLISSILETEEFIEEKE